MAAETARRRMREWEVAAGATAAIAAADGLEPALRALLAGMAALTGAEAGGVRVLDERGPQAPAHRLYFWQGGEQYSWRRLPAIPGTNTARVLETGQGLYTADLADAAEHGDATVIPALRDGIRSSLIVPLRAAGRAIGTLHADARRPYAFAEAQLLPLQVLADHAGGALEQARLRTDAAERLRQLEVAARVSAAVSEAGDLDGMLGRVLEEAAALVGAQRGTVALVDAERGTVRGRVGLGLAPGLLEATVRRLYAAPDPTEDIYALIVRTGEQAVVEDDHPALHRPTTERFGLHNEHRVFTPIRHGGEVIGVLTVSWVGGGLPSPDDLAMLRLIAEQAGGAIARARLAETELAQLRLLERERAKLAESEARFRGAFHSSAVGMALTALDGRFLQVNHAFCRMLGFAEAELLATGFPALTHPDDRAANLGAIPRLLSGELPAYHAEKRYLHRQGQVVWVLAGVSLVRDEDGRPRYFVAQFQDITERKRAEEALAQQYRAAEAARGEASAILDATEDAIILVSPAGTVASMNRRAEELFGYARAAVEGRPLTALAHELARIFGDPHAADWLRARLTDPEPHFSLDVRQRWPVRRDLSLSSTPVRAADGEPLSQLFAFRDITERKRAEEEQAALLAAEAALRDRDMFLSVAAHELKTPVTSLHGFAQLLLRRLQDATVIEPARLRAMVERIDQQAGKLARLVSQLLDFSRLEAGRLALEPEVVDLVRLVRDVTAALQVRAPSRPIVVTAPTAPVIRADPLRLEQVLTNLLDNAFKYSPEDSPVDVTVDQDGAMVRMGVRDHGPGIPVEQRGQVFERFHRISAERHIEGMGLGLYISRQIAELHGGELLTEFPADGGTRFVLTLPLPSGLEGATDAAPERR